MGLSDHPRLAAFRRPSDTDFVAAAQAFLTPERLADFAETPNMLYRKDIWSEMARLGLFSIFAPEKFGGQERGAFGIALLSDCLKADALCSIDLAVYVQGIVAATTLAHNPQNELACALLPKVVTGETIVCSAYTDADRSQPVSAEEQGDNLIINGAKTLIINAIHADYVVATVHIGREGANCIIDMKSPGITLERLARASNTGSFVQGKINFHNVVVPKSNLLVRGISRQWLWETVMAYSRLTNVSSILRAMGALEKTGEDILAPRTVSGGVMTDMPAYALWRSRLRSGQTVLKSTIVECILRLEAKERVGGLVAGVKARAGTTAYQLSAQALDMAGGSGVLAGNPLGKIHASMRCKKFAAGGEYDLLKLYGATLPRPRAQPRRVH